PPPAAHTRTRSWRRSGSSGPGAPAAGGGGAARSRGARRGQGVAIALGHEAAAGALEAIGEGAALVLRDVADLLPGGLGLAHLFRGRALPRLLGHFAADGVRGERLAPHRGEAGGRRPRLIHGA